MATDQIPPSQLFRTLLLHMLETHRILTPYVQHTTSKELKLCHSENTYMLSEIQSWLADQPAGLDLSPVFSAAQHAELRVGVESRLKERRAPVIPAGAPLTPSVPDAPVAPLRGMPRARSSQRSEPTPVVLERNSIGQIVFRRK